jgi:hypothetical protein
MGHWNYRVMKREISEGQFEFGIYEVHYDNEGKVEGWTENPLTPTHESIKELEAELKRMITAFEKETLIYDKD